MDSTIRPADRWFSLWLFAPAAWALYFVGDRFAVLVHEVVGHGFTAWALGGHFEGFAVRLPGGFSYSWLPDGAPPTHELIHRAGGHVSALLTGLAFLALERPAARRGHATGRLVCLVLGAAAMIQISQAVFTGQFSAEREISDVTTIRRMAGDSVAVKALFYALGGAGLVLAPIYLFTRLVEAAGAFIPVATFSARFRVLIAAVGLPLSIFLAFAAPFAAAGEPWRVPIAIGMIAALHGALALVARRDPGLAQPRERFDPRFTAGAIALGVAAWAAIYSWLSEGVHFSR